MRNHYKRAFLYWLFLVGFHTAKAQQFFTTSSFGVQGYYGSFLTTAPKAQYLKDSYTSFGEVYFQRNTAQQIINRQWGAGVFFGNTGSRQYMGSMAGAFSFFHIPLFRTPLWESKVRIGTGLGWIEKPYNKNTNHKNTLIGTHLNGYFNLLWQNEIRISSQLAVTAGLSFSHLSNGGSTLPNLGLNIPALSVGFLYNGKGQPSRTPLVLDSFHRRTSFSVYTSGGWKQRPWIESRRYFVNVLCAEVKKQFTRNKSLGGGAVFFYDRSMEVNPYLITPDKRKGNKVQAGLYASYEYAIGKLSMPLQMGAYVVNKDIYSTLFQQIGFRYKMGNHWSVQLLLKTHGGKAEYLHAGIGYQLK